jgi:hypothetical protein
MELLWILRSLSHKIWFIEKTSTTNQIYDISNNVFLMPMIMLRAYFFRFAPGLRFLGYGPNRIVSSNTIKPIFHNPDYPLIRFTSILSWPICHSLDLPGVIPRHPWMQTYFAYITKKEIPEDLVEARRVIRWSKAITAVKGELYKRSISGVL